MASSASSEETPRDGRSLDGGVRREASIPETCSFRTTAAGGEATLCPVLVS